MHCLTLTTIDNMQAYSIPMKLKYDCPAPAQYGKDTPLWKTATTNFLQIVKTCSSRIKVLGDGARFLCRVCFR